MAELAYGPEEVELLHNDLENSERENRRLRRQVTALRNELHRQRKEHPKHDKARRLYDLWFTQLGKNANTIFDEAREKALLSMLDAYDEAGVDGELLMTKAIYGLAARPYVGPKGRSEKPHPGAKRHDDLRFAVQDAASVERFMGYADEATLEANRGTGTEKAKERMTATLVEMYGRQIDGRPRRYDCFPQLIRALEDHGCEVRGSGARYMAQCPAHEDRSPSLSIKEKDDGMILLHCFAGCDTEAVLDRLGLDFMHLMGVESGRAA